MVGLGVLTRFDGRSDVASFEPSLAQKPKDTTHTSRIMGMSVTVEGEQIPITEETTAAELKNDVDLDEDHLLTYRTDDGLESLNDDDVVANHVDDGTALQGQPLADSYVFG
jgi:hypothetical protein